MEINMNTLSAEKEFELKTTRREIKKNILRMVKAGKSGHVGGALSATDILTALYFYVMRTDPENPDSARCSFTISFISAAFGSQPMAIFFILLL